ncbi:phosphopentomutase [Alicyclobacillus hesperidum subsp. aegles]|uniref:phosphopentomutase n=1 Tax=Alicyclobacillus hesperidum TaxID=89784 RepID=UPI00222BF9D9|nr:phosphopentomutase [Alicyclobacillus hesperidum]GLG01002.1 phosphopentomutase [Alicyclobacillus hesperidum subsp. aegles]
MLASRRCIWIVLDSCGIGAAPDASSYGEPDAMSNTIVHVAEAVGGLVAPNLARLGLGRIDRVPGVSAAAATGAYGTMVERSAGKDTTNGHLEFVGVVLSEPMPTYLNGFPPEIIEPFERYVGKPVLANKPASGTVVIDEYGRLHMQTGRPIVYTSADSVFQVAAHEGIVPVDTLYDWCAYARSILTGRHAVGRVIARPFIGEPGHFVRTDRRRDFSLHFGDTVLNAVEQAGYPVIGIGKIGDIYGGSGITTSIHTHDNDDAMRVVLEQMQVVQEGLIYANLVDFDAKYGHRNDPVGFARAIEAFDHSLGSLFATMRPQDLLIVTADHGCDPTVPGTDHTRERVPLLVWHTRMSSPIDLGIRSTFADIGATVAAFFGVEAPPVGVSFLDLLDC